MNTRLRLTIVLFSSLSLADFLLTWFLLNRSAGIAYESNPIAAWFLDNIGWMGLAMFKALIVLFVIAATIRLEQRRPRSAETVLAFGCAALLAVVGHGASLLGDLHSPETITHIETLKRNEETSRELDQQYLRNNRYHDFVRDLHQAVADGSMPLPIAASYWLNNDFDQEPRWLTGLKKRFKTKEVEMRLAAIIAHELNKFWRLKPERMITMQNQFKEHFGVDLSTILRRDDTASFSISAPHVFEQTFQATAALNSHGDRSIASQRSGNHNIAHGKHGTDKSLENQPNSRISVEALAAYASCRISLRI